MTRIDSANLHALIQKVNKYNFHGIIASFDPGETTGFAVFERGPGHTSLIHCEQLTTWPLERGVDELRRAFSFLPTYLVYETYHVYKWRLAEHTWSEVPTIQVIGAIKYCAIRRGITYYRQTAQIGKGFCSDDKLRYWNLYLEGQPHARDAIRHACQFLLFGPPKDQNLDS